MSIDDQRYIGLSKHATDMRPIEENCPCPTCSSGMSRALLNHTVTLETAAAHGGLPCKMPDGRSLILRIYTAVTQHNLVFQARVMGGAREAIINGTFPQYLKDFFATYYGDGGYPEWCVNALRSVGVDLLEGRPDAKIIHGDGAKWEYSDAA